MAKRCVVVLALDDSGRAVMGELPNGKLKFPAGHLDNQELPREGALRELREETGLKGSGLKCVGVEKHGIGHITYFYTCSFAGVPTPVSDPDKEFRKVSLVDLGESANRHLYPFKGSVFQRYLIKL